MVRVLHFADAHIDIANRGRQDPQIGLPIRVLDFLTALDTIVETAIREKVDLVLFAGDAYKDRTPVPTFQREWGKRIIRLSRAGIPTLMLVGNHDVSPALGRAHTLQEYETLEVPYVRVLNRPALLKPADLWGLPLQVLAIPWISRSNLMGLEELSGREPERVYERLQEILTQLVEQFLAQAEPDLPLIVTAHASVEGAVYGGERLIMLGNDFILPRGLLVHPAVDYVALGHIHKHQDLNLGGYPPVVYAGSIERVDFGEAADDKGFVMVEVERRATRYTWIRLSGRKFIDKRINLEALEKTSGEKPLPGVLMEYIRQRLPAPHELEGAVVRLVLEYPRAWEPLLDEAALRKWLEPALEVHLVRQPRAEMRLRLAGDAAVAQRSPLELLELYWKSLSLPPEEIQALQALAERVLAQAENSSV
ncbi:exonuclease SbcCD subunit D [Thermanaerothrix sp.]|jgi:exonuclease SbcD|uniref:metallophosphoesterase family protein n=1 Tax=Thermanaerothrix sp. TaxID=2972675 RepID=UPI002ADE40B7|nr:exonuclease SbcCD subunit D [Thermanaerothrix sp.]